jgi:hypothetical protein
MALANLVTYIPEPPERPGNLTLGAPVATLTAPSGTKLRSLLCSAEDRALDARRAKLRAALSARLAGRAWVALLRHCGFCEP